MYQILKNVFFLLNLCYAVCMQLYYRKIKYWLISKYCIYILVLLALLANMAKLRKYFIVLNEIPFVTCLLPSQSLSKIWPRGYKTFFVLNSTEHEIFSADKYENANISHDEYENANISHENISWHFHIHKHRKFHTPLYGAYK